MKQILSIIALGSILFISCAPSYQETHVIDPVCFTNTPSTAVFETTKDVLRHMYFTIDKADPNNGYIRTHPLPGAQTFECWRSDNVGLYNTMEANLHSIRRIVELNVTEEREQVCLACSVHVQRLNVPQQQVISTAQAYRILSESTTTIQRLTFGPEQQTAMQWEDLGQDPLLAEHIIKQIKKTTGKRQVVIARHTNERP